MKINDRIFLETDCSCANCGTKGKENLSIHHVDSDPSNNEYENLIVLCLECHQEVDQKNTITREQLEEMKRLLIYKTLTTFGLNAIKIAYRNKHGEVTGMELVLNHLVDMGYLKKTGYALKGGTGDLSEMLSIFKIEAKGIRLYDKWLRKLEVS